MELGNQYNVGTLSSFSLALAPKCRFVWQPCPSASPSHSKAAVYRHKCQQAHANLTLVLTICPKLFQKQIILRKGE